MIQRQQSLWLLLSAVFSVLSFSFPFYNGTVKPDAVEKAPFIDAGDSLFLLIFTGASVLLAIITIFLFKDRKMQFRLCIVGIVLSIIIIAFYFLRMDRFASGGISLTSIFVFASLIGYIMAARGVRKDQKLVKSLDKLR